MTALPTSTELVIVGAGVHGAAAAWEAARRGIDCVLVEREDFAAGTSANSLGIVHGGLRYLQGLDVARARDSALELRTLLSIAPHLVHPLRVRMATYPELLKSRIGLRCGLAAYDLLTVDRNRGVAAARRLPRGRVQGRSALARFSDAAFVDDATGVAQWHDAQAVSPERLVLSYALSARTAGATIRNRVDATAIDTDGDSVVAVRVVDRSTQEHITIRTRVVLDARGHDTGRWDADDSAQVPPPSVSFVRGANLVINRHIGDAALGLRTRLSQIRGVAESRLLFAVPRRTGCAVGTWYFPDRADAGCDTLDEDELAVCLEDIRRMYPGWELDDNDVRRIEVGRVPVHGATPGGAPRLAERAHHEHAADRGGPRGLFHLIGVKLTTGRLEAQRAVVQIASFLRASEVLLEPTAVDGGDIEDWGGFMADCEKRYTGLIGKDVVHRLATLYGVRCHDVIARAGDDASQLQPIPGTRDVLRSEIGHALENECARDAEDVLLRRCALGIDGDPPAAALEFTRAEIARLRDGDSARLGVME